MIAAFSIEQAGAIRIEYAAGAITQKALAKRYVVSPTTIDRLVRHITYAAKAKRPGKLKRSRLSDRPRPKDNTRTRTLLRSLGMPSDELAPPNMDFWKWHAMTAEALAKAAKATYLRRMASLHPDAGGNAAEAQLLNELWHTIRNRFRKNKIEP